MATIISPQEQDPEVLKFLSLPDHTQLPDSDGTIVTNFQELPQSILLTTSIQPLLRQRHPDGNFAIGMNSGIYYWPTDPPLQGCKAPDWFYVPDVPPLLKGQFRRSYVMWQELIAPVLLIEYVSGNGSEERDQTPRTGKFWVYERVIRPAYYAIYEPFQGRAEVFHLVEDHFEPLPANERGHYFLPAMGVELGIWQGRFLNMDAPWLRFWDEQGRLILAPEEHIEQAEKEVQVERQRAEQEQQRAEQERQRAERLAERLRAMGVDPNQS